MIRGSFIFLLAALMLVTSVSCKKTEKGETKVFERNKRQVAELKALHPKFAPALDEQLKRAEAAMESAKAIGDEGDRVKKMVQVNRMLSGGFVSDLAAVDRIERQLREKLTRVNLSAVGRSQRRAVEQAHSDVHRTLKDVRRVLDRGAQDATSATAVLRKVREDIEAADRNLDHLLKATEGRGGAKARAASSSGGAPVSGAPAAMEAPPWKCEYCGNRNDGKLLKCPSCGASR